MGQFSYIGAVRTQHNTPPSFRLIQMPIPSQKSFKRKLCRFVLAGYEAPAQFAEETKRADKVIGWGIVLSVLASSMMGLGFLVCLLFCIQVSSQPLVAPILHGSYL